MAASEHESNDEQRSRDIAPLVSAVEGHELLAEEERARLRSLARFLAEAGHSPAYIMTALRSTAGVLADLREDAEHPQEVFGRENVRRFIEENAVTMPPRGGTSLRREWKRLQRERLLVHTIGLVRRARGAKAHHEVKKMRNVLLKVDQRELRRVLGSEGDELSRQISVLLRAFAAKM